MSQKSSRAATPADATEIKAPVWVAVVKWIGIVLVLAVAAVAVQRLIELGWWIGVVVVGAIGTAVLVVYGRRKGVALKFLLPGLVLLMALQVWPVLYTAATAFTNQGYGNMLSKDEAIDMIVLTSVREVPDTPRYGMSVAVAEGSSPVTGDLVLLLTDPGTGAAYVGTIDGLTPLTEPGVELPRTTAPLAPPPATRC